MAKPLPNIIKIIPKFAVNEYNIYNVTISYLMILLNYDFDFELKFTWNKI